MKTSDNIIINKIQEGDISAFERLFKSYYSPLCDYAYKYVKNPHVAEDQVQDIFTNIWEKKKDWNPKGGIKSYLYRATRNQSLNYLKHQKIVQEWEDEKKATKPTYTDNVSKEINSSEQLRRWIEEAIHQLPQKRRTIYEFSRNHGLTYQEIAEVLNISIKTVETQMRRALKYLRSHLKRNFE